MADAHRPSPMPPDWGDAFGALPLAQAPEHAWRRVADALPVQVHVPSSTRGPALRRGQRTTLAIAASVVVALPVAWWLARPAQPAGDDIVPAMAAQARLSSGASAPAASPRPAADRRGTAAVSVPPARPAVAAVAAVAAPAASRPLQTTAKAPRHPAPATSDARPASRLASQRVLADEAPTLAAATPSAADPDSASVVRLQQESARLEALVALARDDRMASAPAIVLVGEAEDRVRLIDNALSQPGLGDAERFDLWASRVTALREVAGVQGTTRWLAANGESLQGAIALVD